MKLFVLAVVIAIASAAHLDNSYIPPPSAHSAGGSSFLQTPGRQVNNFGTSQFSHSTYSGQPQQHRFQQQGYQQQQHQQQSYHQQSGPVIPILRYNNEPNIGDGSYRFDYETGNGIMAQEVGHLANAGSQNEEQVVSGSYSYPGTDGKTYSVQYKADANGFQAFGDHLPTPPPIPEAIQKSLAFNAAHQGSGGSGQYQGGGGGGGAGQYHGGGGGGGAGQYHGGGGFGSEGGGGGAGQYHGGGGFGSGGGGGGGGAGQFNQGAFSHQSPQKSYLPPNRQSYSPSTGYQY